MENLHKHKYDFKQKGLFVGLLAVRIVLILSVLQKVKVVFFEQQFCVGLSFLSSWHCSRLSSVREVRGHQEGWIQWCFIYLCRAEDEGLCQTVCPLPTSLGLELSEESYITTDLPRAQWENLNLISYHRNKHLTFTPLFTQ